MERFSIVVLVIGSLLGFSIITFWEERPAPPMGPEMGMVIPSAQVKLLGGGSEKDLVSILTGGGDCSLLVLINSRCGVCRRLRGTWPERAQLWVDSVGVPFHLLWLSGEQEEVLASFYKEFPLGPVLPAMISREPDRVLRQLGLFGTPTTYFLDGDGRLRLGLMGDRLPPVELAKGICS